MDEEGEDIPDTIVTVLLDVRVNTKVHAGGFK